MNVSLCRGSVGDLPRIVFIGLLLLLYSQNSMAAKPRPAPNRGADLGTAAGSEYEARELPAPAKSDLSTTREGAADRWLPSINRSLTTALVFVLAIIFLAAWIVKRAYPGANLLFGTLPVLQVLGRTNLGPKQTLTLVRLDGKLLLLGLTDHAVNHVLTIDDPEEVSRLVTLIEQSRSAGIAGGFKHFFSREASEIHRRQADGTEISEPAENLSDENEVLQLKNELSSLINKVEKLKGIGGRSISG
jgi:flagellar biosynthetic protein FliO